MEKGLRTSNRSVATFEKMSVIFFYPRAEKSGEGEDETRRTKNLRCCKSSGNRL